MAWLFPQAGILDYVQRLTLAEMCAGKLQLYIIIKQEWLRYAIKCN